MIWKVSISKEKYMKVSTSKISKITIPLLLIALMSVFVFMTTKAFFTDVQSSSENIFVSGNLSVAVSQDEVLSVQNWKPADEHMITFAVTNTGTVPTQVKGKLVGAWNQSNLDAGVVEITAFERKVGLDWVPVQAGSIEMGEEFYLSADGTPENLQVLQSEETVELRITTRLSATTPDEYQNQTFAASLHIAGKQATEGSSWPAEY